MRGQHHGKGDDEPGLALLCCKHGGAPRLQIGVDTVGIVMLHGQSCGAVVQVGKAGEKELEVVVQLCHRAHGGAAGAYGVGLVDGDCGRYAFNLVYRGFVHAVEKLARVGAEGFYIAALAFGVKRVKNQTGFARATRPRYNGKLARANVYIYTAQIILARATDADNAICLLHGIRHAWHSRR